MRLTQEIKAFIREHADAKPESLALQSKRYPDLPMAFVAQQVKARQRIQKKLPTWHANEDIVFPASLSLEQCSSESAAAYKAGLLRGDAMADLTGGFGVDAFAFSESFNRVYHIERDGELSKIVSENFSTLGESSTVEVIKGDGLDWLDKREEPLDLVYLDPARRDSRRFKVSALEECEPNLAEIWETLLNNAKRVAVKLSPGLDIDHILKSLAGIEEVHVVSIGNECKETFCIAERGFADDANIICVNESASGEWDRFEFTRSREKEIEGDFAAYSQYLYEPNASIMKAGGFKSLGKLHGLPLIHPRTRFYASDQLIEKFPGRVFEILDSGDLRANAAKTLFPEGKANVIARNVGMSSDVLKKKLKLGDGGDLFAIGTMDVSEKRRLLKCRRVV